jgi:hypothetical protein
MRTSRTIIVAAVLALAIGACGPSDPMSDADVRAFAGFSTAYRPVAADMAKVGQAVSKDQTADARAGIEALKPELAATDVKVEAVGNRTVRLLLEDYMRITRRAIAAVDRLVRQLEAQPKQVPSRDLLADVQSTSATLKEADQNLVGRILDQAASDGQKAAIERAITIQN